MAVLLTYHKLVERDEKNVQMHWKGEDLLNIYFRLSFM